MDVAVFVKEAVGGGRERLRSQAERISGLTDEYSF